jgi:long-subunit fatty acid transport protein
MKPRVLVFTIAASLAGTASAGGLLLPGSGAISTSRAGASVAAVDDGESIALNPAGIAKSHGTQVQIGIAAIDYILSFQRNGTYDPISEEPTSYDGQRYPVMENGSQPPLGLGAYQPVPMIAVVSDLGGVIPNLHVAVGLYAPNAYPFRDFNSVNGKPFFAKQPNGGYVFPQTYGDPPPPTRYDVVHEEAAVILPSIDVAYRVLPQLDLGFRYSVGTAQLKSTVALWGLPANYEEWIKHDAIFTVDATDHLVQAYGIGAAFRPTDTIELGANFIGSTDVHGKGNAYAANGPEVTIAGSPIEIDPSMSPRCASGGTKEALKGCVDVELPLTATVGGRYKFLDAAGAEKGDVEVDLAYEHWGKTCDYTKDPTCLNPSDFHVTVDGVVAQISNPSNTLPLRDSIVSHGFQDTYGVRVGGSWSFPMNGAALIARGGASYDSAAALPGWERVDIDGAARTMLAAGASYKTKSLQLDAGFGVILEGTRSTTRYCNPTGNVGSVGCGDGMKDEPVPGWRLPGNAGPDRQGPDPINPLENPNVQSESPVNQGTFKSHYVLLMLGASYWF